MTRSFAGEGHRATDAMARYYARRAEHGVGLVLTESIAVMASGDGFPDAPRLHTPRHAESWRQVTDAVHGAGGRIFAQLFHAGRISHEDYTDGAQPVSSTQARAEGVNRRNGKPYAIPRRLDAEELPSIIEAFEVSSDLAMQAGFDGVELHLAHGYLPDQFFDARVNDRTDAYGGTVENRCRFPLELVRAVVSQLTSERVMVRISPSRFMGGVYDWPDLEAMLEHVLVSFDAAGLRMLDVSCARAEYFETAGRVVRLARAHWPHMLIAGASLDEADAQAELDAGMLDMVTYGRALIANPDLVERLREGRALDAFDVSQLDVLT